jgi:tetratricopeptide (TPR) repeat protein
VREPLPARDPSNWRLRHNLATSYNAIGRALGSAGNTAGALQYLYHGLEIDAPLLAADPNNALFWRILSAHYDHIFVNLKDVDPGKAIEYRREANALDEKVLAADPKNASNRANLALGYMKLGRAYLKAKDPTQASAYFGKSLALYEGLSSEDPDNIEHRYHIAQAYMEDGDAYAQLKDEARALANFRKAVSLLEPLTAKAERKIIFNSILANTYFKLGDLYQRLATKSPNAARWREARSWYERSLSVFEHMREINMLQDKDDINARDDAQRAIVRCDEELAK